jgi:hypothetical protein
MALVGLALSHQKGPGQELRKIIPQLGLVTIFSLFPQLSAHFHIRAVAQLGV